MIIAGAVLALAMITGTADAATRNCTKAEKQAADAQLLAIAADMDLQQQLRLRHAPFGLPLGQSTALHEQLLYQGGYIMAHDSDLLTSLWVSYSLSREDIDQASGKYRVNCFRSDPRLKNGEGASTADYREPVYDQGHMANDADLKDNLLQQINSYVMSNMSPQHCRFNRGIWLSLEHLTRIWARKYGEIIVTSGAIFDHDGSIGRDDDANAIRMKSNNGKTRVAVPDRYFKSYARIDDGELRTISFVLSNDNNDHGVTWQDVKPVVLASIVQIEAIEISASLDLYPALKSDQINESRHGEDWDFSAGMSNFSASCK